MAVAEGRDGSGRGQGWQWQRAGMAVAEGRVAGDAGHDGLGGLELEVYVG